MFLEHPLSVTPLSCKSICGLPCTFEAVNTACYVQNRVLVVKPHNKNPYEIFHGRTPTWFSKNTPNVVGSGPNWLFDIDALTRRMNYEPIFAGTQSNGFACTKATDNAGQASKETEPVKDYILLPLWTVDPSFSHDPKSSQDDQEKEDNVNNTNNVNTVSLTVNAAGTNEDNELPFNPNMRYLEDVGTFKFSNKDEDDDATEAFNTACYVQTRVLVVKPHNKNPYEIFHGRTPTLSFMRPFVCPVTILNTKDHLVKFDGKDDEGFFIGYSLNSKAFRVFNSRTRIVEENFHIRFSKNTPNVVGSGPDWLFDIDALTRRMNYEPIFAGTQSNGFACTKATDNAGQASKETEPVKDYILLPLWTADPSFSHDPKSSQDDGFKPSSDDGKKVNENPSKRNECNDQEKEDNVNNTNNVNTVSLTVNAAGTNEDNELPFNPNMPYLEDVGTFKFSNKDEDDDAVADMN
nr:ribonuclease H-like domain-containing protein [Tanacetum cinerariifolium]